MTNIQVRREPIARCIKTAATVESTPPEMAHITRPCPTCSLILPMDSLTKFDGVQAPDAPQIFRTKFAMISAPWGVCTTSGWNCMPYSPIPFPMAALGEFCVYPIDRNPGGKTSMRSPWLIQTGVALSRPSNNTSSSGHRFTTA